MSDLIEQRLRNAREAWDQSLRRPILDLRRSLQEKGAERVAHQAGAELQGGQVQLTHFGARFVLELPDYAPPEGTEIPTATQALLLYYLVTADGAPLSERWVGFRELPGGSFYHEAFQGYAGNRLAAFFGMTLPAFELACRTLGGERSSFAETAFRFQAFPRFPLLAVVWAGDEEFAPRGAILFDSTACHYLPLDACAIVGSSLVQRLIRAGEQLGKKPSSTSTTPLTAME